MTIYNLPNIVKGALPRAATPTNIQKGFKVTGICPFDREIFGEEDFMACEVTNRPDPSAVGCEENPCASSSTPSRSPPPVYQIALARHSPMNLTDTATLEAREVVTSILENIVSRASSASPAVASDSAIASNNQILPPIRTPEMIRPFPKAGKRKVTQERRRKHSAILTSTPEKLKLEAGLAEKKKKKTTKLPTKRKLKIPTESAAKKSKAGRC